MSTKPTDEVKLRNYIVKYSVGSLFKIYTYKTYKPDPTTGAPTTTIDHDNEPLISDEMLKLARARKYIGSTSTDLSLVPPPLVHDLLVKSIDKLKADKKILPPPT